MGHVHWHVRIGDRWRFAWYRFASDLFAGFTTLRRLRRVRGLSPQAPLEGSALSPRFAPRYARRSPSLRSGHAAAALLRSLATLGSVRRFAGNRALEKLQT